MIQDNTGGRAMGSTPSSPQPSPQAGGVKHELADDAKTIGTAAKERVGNKAAEGKERAAQAAHSTSSALDKAVEQLRQDESTPSWLTSSFETASREIDRFASNIEGKDMKAIGGEITAFARRSPVAFLAASAAAGFAAARVLRAGSDYQEHGGASGQQPRTASTGAIGDINSRPGASSDRSSFNWADEGSRSSSTFERAGQ